MKEIPQSDWLKYVGVYGECEDNPSVENIEALKQVARVIAKYAPGRAQIQRDASAAERIQNWEVAGALSSVLRGVVEAAGLMRELYGEAKKDFDTQDAEERAGLELPPKPAGFSHRWHPDETIWPNNETLREIVNKLPAFSQGFPDLTRQAVKAVYKLNWKEQFTGPDGNPVRLTDDHQGWSLRERVLELTKKNVAGASTVSPLELAGSVCVFDGAKLFHCSGVSENPFEEKVVNAKLSGRDSVRPTHEEEVWVCLPLLQQRTIR